MTRDQKNKNLIQVEAIPFEMADGSFIAKELPVILKGGAQEWPAYKKWSVDFFKEVYGDVTVPLSNYRKNPYQSASTKERVKISDYLESAIQIAQGKSHANEDLYSAGWFFCKGHCELLKDIALPNYFQDNWAEKVQKIIHFDTRSILFGHPKVESPLHTDSFFVSTYFAMIRGQKRMRLVHPKDTQHVHNGYDVFNDEKLAILSERDVSVYDCTICEGDIVWFPPGWWHHVKNDTFTISITTSFVSDCHFLPFEQQVRSTILKPLFSLARLKWECLNSSTVQFTTENIRNSRFSEIESKYLSHFQEELKQTENILRKIAAQGSHP